VFDPAFDQAAGLRGLEGPSAVRVLPVVLARESQPAFDLAWTLGASLSALGHRVVALDAAGREGAGRPGLAQLLKSGAEPSDDESAWRVIPSQSGLQTLLHVATTQGAEAAMIRLASCFPGDSVVLLLAPKEWLGVLLENVPVRPVVPLTFQPTAVVDAYSALKVLHQAAGVQSVLVAMPSDMPDGVGQQALQVLCETTTRHLGWLPESWDLPDGQGADARETLTRWVLRMLESALLIEEPVPGTPGWSTSNPREALVPQLWSC
jgi:hypothetical protein